MTGRDADRVGLEDTQRALLNILEDFGIEKGQIERTQKATLNILDDFNSEKLRLEETQRAVLNILEDFGIEKGQIEKTQKATLNILDDFNSEKLRLEDTQRALLNILDDFDVEKLRVERANQELREARNALEVRVHERTAELEASNKELESFSYSVSHDLRAPLRILDGFSRAVLEDYGDKLDAEGKEYLNHIRSSSQLMAKLIDDILNLSRITRAELHLQKVDLSALAREVAAELDKTGSHKVEWVIADGLQAFGDTYLLRLVFQNLLGNAYKFTGKRPDARVEFGLNDEQAFYVRDNGAGFDMAYADKLFKPFQRLHRAEDFPGTGIGLASVLRIISRLGGKVWAESQPDKGATFYFALRNG